MTRRRKLRRYLVLLLGPGLLVGLLVFLKFSQISLLMAKGKEMEAAGPRPEAVGSSVAQTQTWEETLDAVGTVAGVKSVVVANDSPGRVLRIRFESGADVERGQVLVELDTSEERAQLGTAISRRDLAAVNVKRSRALVAEHVATQAQLDTDEATLAAAITNVAAIEAQIQKKIVRAPFAGRLGIREVDVGEYLSPGTRLTTLETLGEFFVDFSLPQEDLPKLAEGMAVRVVAPLAPNIPAAPGVPRPTLTTIPGVLAAVDPSVDPSTRNLKLRASVPNPEDSLRAGMFVNVSVVIAATKPVVAIPATAVVYAPYGDSVFVVEDKKPGAPGMRKTPKGTLVQVARQQFVRLGEQRGDFISIEEGVAAGQRVVSAGAFKLRNGSPIAVDDSLNTDPKLNPRPENR